MGIKTMPRTPGSSNTSISLSPMPYYIYSGTKLSSKSTLSDTCAYHLEPIISSFILDEYVLVGVLTSLLDDWTMGLL